MQSDILLLPNDYGFEETMILGWKLLTANTQSTAVFGSDGVLRSIADERTLNEYLYGGEYDERLTLIGDESDDDDVIWLDEED